MRKLAGGVVREERRVSELAEALVEDVSSLQKYTAVVGYFVTFTSIFLQLSQFPPLLFAPTSAASFSPQWNRNRSAGHGKFNRLGVDPGG